MSDYRLKVSVRNARILKAIEAAGYRSVKSFCDAEDLNYTDTIALIGMRNAPITTLGEFSETAKGLMAALCALPQELWSERQMTVSLKRSTLERDVSEEDAMQALANVEAAKKLIESSGISPREERVLQARFIEDKTSKEVGEELDVSGGRIQQIEAKALRKLRIAALKEGVSGHFDEY